MIINLLHAENQTQDSFPNKKVAELNAKNALATTIAPSEEFDTSREELEIKVQKKIEQLKKDLEDTAKTIKMSKKTFLPWNKFHTYTPFLFSFLSVLFFHKTNAAFSFFSFIRLK